MLKTNNSIPGTNGVFNRNVYVANQSRWKNWKKYSKLLFVFPNRISKSNIHMCVCVRFTRKFRSPTQIIVLLHDNYSPQQSIHSYKSLPFPVNLSLSITTTPPNAHIRKEIRFVLHIYKSARICERSKAMAKIMSATIYFLFDVWSVSLT